MEAQAAEGWLGRVMDPRAEERDLVRRALDGDTGAFESLYREHVGASTRSAPA